MKKKLLIIFFFFSLSSYSQWTYKSGKNDFDGSYKTSMVFGSGGEFPYTKPLFVINKFENSTLNMYISNVGYSGCNNRIIYFKFNSDEKIYETRYVSNGSNNDTWFLSSFDDLKDYEFIEKLMNHSLMSVRIKSDCGYEDYKFNLTGSSRAINYVLGQGWVNNEKKLESELIFLEKQKDSLKIVYENLRKKEERIKDSIYKEKKRKESDKVSLELEQKRENLLVRLKKFKEEYTDFKYIFCESINSQVRLFQFMHDIKPKKIIQNDKILIIDTSFENKVFYKVEYTEGFGKYEYYVLKSEVKKI